jgi:hypothetical protein
MGSCDQSYATLVLCNMFITWGHVTNLWNTGIVWHIYNIWVLWPIYVTLVSCDIFIWGHVTYLCNLELRDLYSATLFCVTYIGVTLMSRDFLYVNTSCVLDISLNSVYICSFYRGLNIDICCWIFHLSAAISHIFKFLS